jgi:polyhydroxyalkanoate synthesis repressor PhaR
MKILKRYANRRLYDSETSKTITLEDVAGMIMNGDEIQVIDNLTGENITQKILGQTFLKVSVGQRNEDFANFMLTSLIREAGRDISSFFQRLVWGGFGAQLLTSEKLDKILQSMVELGDLKPERISSYRDDILRKVADQASERKEEIQKELLKISTDLAESPSQMEDFSSKMKGVAEKLKDNG